MKRPNCRRCGKPLSVFHDPEYGVHFTCDVRMTDDEFDAYVARLPGDDVAKLERILMEREAELRPAPKQLM